MKRFLSILAIAVFNLSNAGPCFAFLESRDTYVLQQARAENRAHNYEAAIQLYQTATQYDALRADAMQELGALYIKLKRYDDAERELIELSARYPLNERVVLDLAAIYIATNRASEAVSSYQSYLLKHPDDVQIQMRLAQALEANHDLDAARDLYQTISQSGGESAAKAMQKVASIDLIKQKSNSTQSFALPARDTRDATELATTPASPASTKTEEAVAQPTQSEPSGAQQPESAGTPNPSTHVGKLRLVVKQMGTGQYSEAKRLLHEMSLENPNDAQVHYLNAICLVETRETSGARKEYERVLQLNPSSGMAKLASLGLSKLAENHGI